jgi:hypothetical protein
MATARISGIFARMTSSKPRALRSPPARFRLLGPSAVACLALGCSGDPEPSPAGQSPNAWVGAVEGSDVKVGLANQDGMVLLFFCGGSDSYASHTRWFTGDGVRPDPFSFAEAGWSIEGAIGSDGSITGTLRTESDDAGSWSAEPVAPRTLAGLYEGAAPCGRLGLIVTQATTRDEPSGQGACLRVEGELAIVEQVNPVRLEWAGSERELLVTVSSAPNEEFTVRPVANAER